MLQSLRFRLPALFLAGVVLAGIVSAAIAFRLLQSYSEDHSLKELRREAGGLTSLYAQAGHQVERRGRHRAGVRRRRAREGNGRPHLLRGPAPLPGETAGLRRLPAA